MTIDPGTERDIERMIEETTPEQKHRVWRAIVRGSLKYYEELWRARRLAQGDRE